VVRWLNVKIALRQGFSCRVALILLGLGRCSDDDLGKALNPRTEISREDDRASPAFYCA
jgi:hypothetical protein